MRRARARSESWASCSMRPAGSCSSMPSITGGLNGAPAGRFLDVPGWVGVLFPSTERTLIGSGPAPIRVGAGLRAPVAMVVSPRPERAGQADQDGRPCGAALPSIDLSVVRGVGSSTVVPGSVGSYRPVIAGAKLREGTTTMLPRGRALQGVGLSSMRFHPTGGGHEDDKDGQEAWFTARIASLIG